MFTNRTSKLKTEHEQAEQDFQRKLHQAQRTAENDSERVRKRTDAEILDLKQHITSLESRLAKVKHLRL